MINAVYQEIFGNTNNELEYSPSSPPHSSWGHASPHSNSCSCPLVQKHLLYFVESAAIIKALQSVASLQVELKESPFTFSLPLVLYQIYQPEFFRFFCRHIGVYEFNEKTPGQVQNSCLQGEVNVLSALWAYIYWALEISIVGWGSEGFIYFNLNTNKYYVVVYILDGKDLESIYEENALPCHVFPGRFVGKPDLITPF